MINSTINIQELAGVQFGAINKEDLIDVSGLTFDTSIPREQRAARIIQAVGNPYCFRVGDLGVKLEFMDHAPPLQDTLADLLQRKKSGL